jgi:predicted RNase H-like HicB family nuclease
MAYVINNRVFRTLSEAQKYITESDFAVTPTITEITNPEQIRSILDPTRFVIGPGFDDQETFKEPGELDPVITSTNTGASRLEDTTGIWQSIFTQMGREDLLETGGELLQILLETTKAGQPGAPIDESQLRTLTQEQREAALEAYLIFNQSLDRAQEIVDTMIDNPAALEGMEDPGEVTNLIIEQNALGLLGPSAATPVTSVPQGMVIRGGAGVTVDISEIGSISDVNLETIFEHLKGYIPGVSLPSWLPSAGVIFIPDIQGKVRQVNDAIGGVVDSIGDVLTGEASVQDVLDAMGGVITDVFDAVVYNEEEGEEGILESAVSGIFGAIKDVLEGTADATTTGTVVGGVITSVLGSSLPTWLPGVLTTVFGSGSPVLPTIQRVLSEVGIDLPLTEEVETEQDPALMFTHRGDNYFVNKTEDEYFQLAESEDIDFEFNGQYTREQLEDTGLETINSGTYQSLLDDLSFHALEEDIYQYSMEDLIARYEEEGGVLPSDWKLMDEESQYNFFLDDYFDIPRTIEDPSRDDRDPEPEPEPPVEPEPEPPVEPPPTDQPEPEPEPPTDEPEPEPTPTDIESLFADFLAQIDEEFTGQIEQVNEIIQNFVETLPDFDAMPTMEDIAEYFEINGVTLSEQNFERIRQELADAGYLTQEQLTEALAGVATPEQVQQAIEGAGFATPEQVIQALAEAGYATPDDITNALANSGFVTEDRMLQALAEAGYATPEQVREIVDNAVSNIVIPEGATAEEVRQLIQEAIDGIPEGISLEDVGDVVNEAIANIEFPEGLSGDDVRSIVDSFGFATAENVQDIVNTAIANIQFPEGATTEEVRQLIQEALDGLPEGISLEDIGGIVNEAIANIEFPEGLSEGDVRGIVDSFGFATSADVQAGFDDLNDKIDNVLNGIATQFTEQEAAFAADLLGLETSVFQQLAATEGALRDELLGLGEDLDSIRADFSGRFDEFADTFALFQTDVGEQFANLNDRFDDAINGIATQFSDQEAEFLASITGLEASLIQSLAAVEGGLSAELEMLGTDLISLQEDVAGRFDEFESFTSEQFALAADERQQLQQAIIAANGDITQLSVDMQQMFADFGGTITDLFAGVGVDIEALQAGQITQQEALDQLRTSIGQQFSTAQEERQELQQAIIAVGGDVTQLSDDMMLRFQQQDQSIEELFAGTNVNIEALRQGQITQQEAFDAYQQYTTEQFGQAQQDRLALAQEIISVGGQVEALSADSQQRFAELGLSLADLQEEFNVNLLGLQQGQISQAEAFDQFRDSVTTRLGLAEEEREEILTRQADFERMYGEDQQALQQQIMAGNVLTALAAGGMFAAPAAPTRAPYEEFMKGITYRPREAPQLAIKTPALDYNEEAQKLLMRTRRRGMLV